MKNHYQEKIEKKVLDHFQLLSAKGLKVLCIMLFTFYSGLVSAQNSVLFLTWDMEVGCVNGSNDDPRNPKDYFELIEAGESLRVCQGATVIYTLHVHETSWTDVVWDVAGGTITGLSPDKTICTVVWASGAVGSIGATILTTGETRVLPDLGIELIRRPTAKFWKAPVTGSMNDINTLSGIQVCANELFTFDNLSSANNGTPIVSYYWEFGDGTTSTEFEPSHVYTDSGSTYTVTLTVTNQCNCKSTVKQDVHVGKKSVNIVCPAVVCEGQTATYRLEDLGGNRCEPFDWDVQGGVILSEQPYGSKIDVLWTPSGALNNTLDGFGYVSFDPRGCGLDCFVETKLKIPVITDNMRFKGPTSVCGNSQNRYTMPQWPTTDFVWEVINTGGTNAFVVLTDQRNEIILNPGTVSGTIILRVTYQNTLLNCGGTSQQEINIKKDASIVGPREVCLNEEVQYYLEDNSQVVNWTLRLLPNGPTTVGSGSELNTLFTTPGNYSLAISGNTICNGEAVIIKVRSPETPVDTDIIGSRVVCPSTVSEFSIVNNIPNSIIGWSVPPGVGTIVGSSYGDEIQVIWNYPTVPAGEPYTLNVWRETTTDPSCPSPLLTINLTPENLNLSIGGEPFPCGSTGYSYSLPSGIIADTFEWSISPPGAGSILNNGGASITVLWNQFPNPQSAIIKVKATKCNITQDSEAYNIVIDNPSITLIEPPGPFCPRDLLDFSIDSSVPLQVPTGNIIWEFGDGSPAQYGTDVQHSYASGGTYTVSVRVINPNGCPITLSKSTTVIINPDSLVTIANPIVGACSPNPFSVTFEAQLGAGTTVLGWYAVGNNTSLGTGNTLTVSAYGNYYVEVASGFCIKKAFCRVIDCSPPCVPSPVPSLTLVATPGCSTISAVGSFDIPGPTGFNWGSNFITDALVPGSTNNTANFSFSEPGNHIISYDIAYNNQDCYTRTTTSVFIPYVPRVDAAISCGTNNYNLTITDQSLIDPNIAPSYVFTINGNTIPQGANPANSWVIPATAGTYFIEMTISGGAYPCTVTKTITLPAFPDATFTVADQVCQGYSAGFTVNNQVPGDTYSWDFGDNTYNLQQNPYKEYSNATDYFATLTVTNLYCSASFAKTITVLRNEQRGLIATPLIGCPGGNTSLSFTSTGFPDSASFQWLLNNQPLAGATNNPQTVSQPGSYSIEVATDQGCKKRIAQSVPVAFAKPPFSAILGPDTVCENQPFRLYVKAGSQAGGLVYEWREGNVILSNTPSLSFGGLSGGNYTYTLTVKIPLAGGGFCTMPPLSHTVSVVGLPEVTAFSVLTCQPEFRVELSASASELGGVYNWSNGASTANISDPNGGAFQVTYTSEAGCKDTFDIEVPKNPENYLWIFPDGCYTFCSEFNTGTLIGPSIKYFDKWDWLKNDSSVFSGGIPDQVQPYDLTNISATYNLQLETSLAPNTCKVTSKDMIVEIVDCECEIAAEVLSVIAQTVPFNYYQVSLYISNPFTLPQQVMVLAPNELGVMTTSSVSVPFPGATFTFMLLPEIGFNGDSYLIKLKATGSDGQLCETDLETYFPSFDSGGEARNGESILHQTTLRLVPNPANNQTYVHYDFGNNSLPANTSIEVYDIYGRQLEQLLPAQNAASWAISTSVYQSGIYIIVMKQDGKIVQQKNLVIAH